MFKKNQPEFVEVDNVKLKFAKSKIDKLEPLKFFKLKMTLIGAKPPNK